MDDITTPEGLVTAVAQCRAVITGSYHAALFSLAAGVPAVCLTKSPYYDTKFGGLAALFPGACATVSLDGPDVAARLRAAVGDAWLLPPAARTAAAASAAGLRERRRGRPTRSSGWPWRATGARLTGRSHSDEPSRRRASGQIRPGVRSPARPRPGVSPRRW